MAPPRPNFLIVMTDDQDAQLGGLTPMAKTRSVLIERGVSFVNAFVATPLCCPSRATYLTGLYPHNTLTVNNSLRGGCAARRWTEGAERHTFAVALQREGYHTALSGKYLNLYAMPGTPDCPSWSSRSCFARVPPGWDDWFALQGNARYYHGRVSDNGELRSFGGEPADYLPDVFYRRTRAFLEAHLSNASERRPFLAVLATPACHSASLQTHAEPPPRLAGRFGGARAPRTPNYNASGAAKHWLVRQSPPLSAAAARLIDRLHGARRGGAWRRPRSRRHSPPPTASRARPLGCGVPPRSRGGAAPPALASSGSRAAAPRAPPRFRARLPRCRWASLLAVDEHVAQLVGVLRRGGQLGRTYVVLTSDHGFQLGQHRRTSDKRQPYEHDLRVPLVVAGPAAAANATVAALVASVDLAPTLVHLATGRPPAHSDGRSFAPLLAAPASGGGGGGGGGAASAARRDLLVSYSGEGAAPCGLAACWCAWTTRRGEAKRADCATSAARRALARGAVQRSGARHLLDAANNSYQCVRALGGGADALYCEFDDDERFVEFFDHRTDPWQLRNRAGSAAAAEHRARLRQLRGCRAAECWQPGTASQSELKYVASLR